MCWRAPVPSVVNLGITTGKEVSAWPHHVFRKRILLAEEHERVFVIVQSFLGVAAFLFEVAHSVVLVMELVPPLWLILHVVEDAILVRPELVCASFELFYVIHELSDGFTESFQTDHEFSFGFNATFVSMLVEDWLLPEASVFDMFFELVRDYIVVDVVVAVLIHVVHLILLWLRLLQFPVISVAVVVPFWIITVIFHIVESSVSIGVPHGHVMELESVFGVDVVFMVTVRVEVVMIGAGVVA